MCWGRRQSPIDIDTSDVYDEVTAKALAFSVPYATALSGTVTNSAYHTLKFAPTDCDATRTISGKLIFYFHFQTQKTLNLHKLPIPIKTQILSHRIKPLAKVSTHNSMPKHLFH